MARGDSTETSAEKLREQLQEMSRGYVLSRAIHIAAELGIADHLDETYVPTSKLAAVTGAQPAFLARLLRFLAGYQIFSEGRPGEFRATPLSNLMRDDAASSLRPALRIVNSAWWAAVGGLLHTIKTGETAFSYLQNEPFFPYLKSHPDDQARFDVGMASNSLLSDQAIAQAYDFSKFSTVVDVGGGRGGLISAILQSHPGVKGVLFDQPQVLEHALPRSDRCTWVAGDFFKEVPGGAELYLLKGVLHDFPDDRCVEILKVCRRAMPPQGRILLIERVVFPDNLAHQAKTIDLIMMALLGGRERSLTEWERLLAAAELKLERQIPTASEFTISEAGPV